MKLKVEMEFTDNQGELINGYGYNVLYQDLQVNKMQIAAAIFKDDKFEYFPGRFFSKDSEPSFESIAGNPRIIGFCRLAVWIK